MVGIVKNLAGTQYPSVPRKSFLAVTRYPENFFWPVPGTQRYPRFLNFWFVSAGTHGYQGTDDADPCYWLYERADFQKLNLLPNNVKLKLWYLNFVGQIQAELN